MVWIRRDISRPSSPIGRDIFHWIRLDRTLQPGLESFQGLGIQQKTGWGLWSRQGAGSWVLQQVIQKYREKKKKQGGTTQVLSSKEVEMRGEQGARKGVSCSKNGVHKIKPQTPHPPHPPKKKKPKKPQTKTPQKKQWSQQQRTELFSITCAKDAGRQRKKEISE